MHKQFAQHLLAYHSKQVHALTELITRAAPDGVTFLCGAGISCAPPTSLPTVRVFVEQLLTYCGAAEPIRRSVLDSSRRSEPRFEKLVDGLRRLNDPTLAVGAVFSSARFNETHAMLASRLQRGSAVVTTNFDNCIELAAEPARLNRVSFNAADLDVAPNVRGLLCKPHGSIPTTTGSTASLVISITNLNRTAKGFAAFPGWHAILRVLFDARTLIVLGYSGSDDFDITPLLLASNPRQMIWLEYSPEHYTPVAVNQSEVCANAAKLGASLNVTYYKGQLAPIVGDLNGGKRAHLPGPSSVSCKSGILQYLESHFRTEVQRKELLNVMMLHYGLYRAVADSCAIESVELLLQRIEALFRLGRHADVINAAAGVDQAALNSMQATRLHHFTAAAWALTGSLVDAVAAAEKEVASAAREGAFDHIAALNHLGGIQCQARNFPTAEGLFQDALASQKMHTHLEAEATSLWGLAVIKGAQGDFQQYLRYMHDACILYEAMGDQINIAWSYFNIADAYQSMGSYPDALEHLNQAEALFRVLEHPSGCLYVAWLAGKISYAEEDWLNADTKLGIATNLSLSEPGFPWILDLVILFNLTQRRLGRDSRIDSFAGTAFAQQLQKQDADAGFVLRRILESGSADAIKVAEAYVYGGNTH